MDIMAALGGGSNTTVNTLATGDAVTTAPQPTQPATRLNAEAGDHVVTADPAALAAGSAAVERTYQVFPYYQLRYGERGRAFSASDSGWLMTIADLDDAAALSEIQWLNKVLAARGMPSLLMEVHLRHLAQELDALVADGQQQWADRAERFRRIADALQGARRLVMPAEEADALVSAFVAAAPAPEAARLPHTGELLAAALADERDGVRQAVPSVLSWLADAERFPRAWLAAVHALVAAGQARPEPADDGPAR